MTEPTLLSRYAAEGLIERIAGAHCDESTIDVAASVQRLTEELAKVGRPRPCGGELAPEAHTYGPAGTERR